MGLYYRPSNKMPVGGVAFFLLSSVLTAAVLALCYGYATWYCSIAVINLFLCLGFGAVLGVLLILFARIGKLRSPAGVEKLALLVGLVAVYLEWSVYITLLFNSETTGAGPNADTSTSFSVGLWADVLTHPGAMWKAIREMSESGTWSVKGITPTGIVLGLFWLAELAIIVGGPYLLANAQATVPFSEVTNEWAIEETMPATLGYVHDADQTRAALEAGEYHTLAPHVVQSEEEPFARLKLYHAPNDPNCHYLSLENVVTRFDEDGEPLKVPVSVVSYLVISPTTHEELKKRFG